MTSALPQHKNSIAFLEHFSDLKDPRQLKKLLYPLDEMLLLSLLAVLAGADSWVDIERFGKSKLGFLRQFRPFINGTPSHDQLGDVFSSLDAETFQACFINWVSSLTGLSEDIVAIDGKTLRRSYQQGGRKGAIHMLSAFSTGQNLILGQMKVADKTNEITAIPKLLDLLSIKGAIITIDAMGCQHKIAEKIIEKKADYVFSLKGNQSSLLEDVQLYFTDQEQRGFADTLFDRYETIEKSHGRIETRTCIALDDIEWLKKRHNWEALTSISMVQAVREFDGKIETETRYFISSLEADAQKLAQAIRSHWKIENTHHWVMDVAFREDECRVRTGNAPANFSLIRHIAANLLRAVSGKESMRLKRRMAAWDEKFLTKVICKSVDR